MGRKKKRFERKIFPDIVYNNIDIEKFINIIMLSGKKTVARNILYKSFNYIRYKFKKDPIIVFSRALDNVAPLIELKPLKKKFNNYVEIKNYRRKSLSMRWIKISSKNRKEKHMYLKLANEFMDAFKKKGESIKKRNNIYKFLNNKKRIKNVKWNK